MATYSNRLLKSGHINVAIQIYIKDETGKFVYKCTTFDNPDNLTGKRLEKAAHAYGEEWERQMKMGKVHKYNDATFSQIANMWLDRKQYSMSATYLVRATDCVKRMKQYFGNLKFIDIKAIQVQDFFNYLNNYTFTTYKAQPKKEKIEELNKIILEYGARRTENEGGISRTTLYYARKGETITYESAKIICNKFHLNFNELFDRIVDERKYKKETILKYQRVLSAIFAYAIKIDLVSKNYATSYYTKDFIGGERIKDIPILSNSEYDRFVKSLDKYDLFQTIPLYLLATLGLRTCEVCGLKWEDINFEKNVVSIKRDRVYVDKEHHCVVNDTKTKYSIRTINMCDLLVEKLKEFKSIYDTLRQDDKSFVMKVLSFVMKRDNLYFHIT